MNFLTTEKWIEDCRCAIRGKLEPFLWLRDMGAAASLKRPRTFKITYPQLGDHWVALSHFVRFKEYSRQPHRISLQASQGITVEMRKSLLVQIAKILKVEEQLEFTDLPAELELPIHPARNGQTLVVPNAASSQRELIAYQFDGISHSHWNPTDAEVQSFFESLPAKKLCRIGRPLTLEESMNILLKSSLFIGVSSGMSHLAASAGTPTFIYCKGGLTDNAGLEIYRRLKRWNCYPKTKFFSTLPELKRLLDN